MDAFQILESPDYINANPATKRAIFDKHIAPTPDYAKANPATQKAIQQRFNLELAREYSLTDIPGEVIANAPASAAKFAGDIYTAVTNPVQTATGLADLAAGGLRAGAKAVLPAQVFQFIDQIDNPETTKRISDTANALGGQLAQDYGSYEGIKRKMATDPVAFFADFSTLLTGGALATARVAPGVSNVMARGAAATDPLLQTARAGVGGVNALRSAAENISNPLNMVNSAVQPYVDPGAVAVNQFVRATEDPGAAAAALRATQNAFVTPGAPSMSVTERLVEGGVPSLGVASLEQGLAGSSPSVNLQMRGRELQQQSAIQQQLARVEQMIQTQAASMAPADLSQLRQVRNDLLRGLADEQTTLANTAQGVAQPLPTVRQADVGGAIQARGAERSEQLRREYIRPGFQEAFAAAGDAPVIDLGRSMAAAERFVGDIGALVDPTKVSSGVRNMLRLDADPVAGPPVVSLEDFQSVRAALNSQYAAAARTDPTRAAALQTVIRQMDADLNAAPLPQAAKDALLEAHRRVSEVQVPMFRTGETSKMLSQTTRNMPGTLPSRQVEAFLNTEEGAAQFVRTFESDPPALQSMQQGVLDLYRRDIVDPTTRAVDAKKAAAFDAKYARQIDTLEAAGLNVRETMEMVRRDATAVQRATEALTKEAAKFSAVKSADEVVDLALQSPSNMTSVRNRLTPTARTALSDELTNRATSALERGDAAGALGYLTKNEKAIKIGLGKAGAKTYNDLVELANLQKDFLDVLSQAPKNSVSLPVTIPENLTSKQLTSLKVVVDDLARIKAVNELGTPKDKAAGKGSTEAALEAGAAPTRIPGFMIAIVTATKSALKSILDFQDRRVAAVLFDKMIKDPDSLIAPLEAAAKAKAAATTAKQPPRPLTIPVGVERAARGATAVNALSQDNQNAMAR